MPDDLPELAFDARVEAGANPACRTWCVHARAKSSTMRDRRELFPVKRVGFGFDVSVTTRNVPIAWDAPAGVDRHGRLRKIPPDPHPAVAAGGVVLDGKRRLYAVSAGGEIDGV